MKREDEAGEMLFLKLEDGETPKECAKRNGLDMRYSYSEYAGWLCTTEWVTTPCSGCNSGGCSECGYQGKRSSPYPQMIWSCMKTKLGKLLTP